MPVNLQWEIHVFQNPTSEIPTPPSASASNDGDPGSLEIAALVCSLLHVDEAVAAKPDVAADALKIQIGQCRPLARAAILAALLSGGGGDDTFYDTSGGGGAAVERAPDGRFSKLGQREGWRQARQRGSRRV
jgi:hypothetical protein